MSNKKEFPIWFINEIVNPEIKQRALSGDLSSTETIEFCCSKGHHFNRRVGNYIKLSTMEKLKDCPECRKASNRKFPKEFIDFLLNEEDKKKAIEGTLKASDRVTLVCPKGHVTSSLVAFRYNFTDNKIIEPLCSVCSKEESIIRNREKNKKEFPQWFIDSLLYEKDKERARNGVLASEEPLYFKCSKGHITKSILYNKIRVSDMTPKNSICSICAMEEMQKKRKETINKKWIFPQWFIDELVNEEDKQKALTHTLSGEDIVKLRCSRGHEYFKKVSQRIYIDGTPNYGCSQCFREDQSLIATPKFEYPQWFIDELVDNKDIELAKIGKLPLNKKVEIKCPKCGFIYKRHVRLEMSVKTKERRKICNKCRLEEKKVNPLLNRQNYPEWFINMLANEEDKQKARNKMLRVEEVVQYRCPKGHIYSATVYSRLKLSTGEKRDLGCNECAKEIRPQKREETMSKKRIFPQWFIDELVNEKDKEKARNKTLNTDDIVQFKCPVGHIYTQRVGGHIHVLTGKKSKGCNICFYETFRSQQELEIDTYVKFLGFVTEHKRFKNPNNSYSYFEVDVYMPDKKIGIEYNGCFWHKTLPEDKFSYPRLYHQNKYLACKQLGIRLISIFEPDWTYRKDKIKQYLRDLLLPIENKLYARKCEIKQIDYHTANSMYEEYHLLGKTTVQAISYGLYYNNELLSCMSFQKGRYTENNQPVWTLTRFVTKSGYSIVGGASKLLSQFEKDFKPDLLLSYSDNDYFSGGLYFNLGFENKGCTNSPRYFWWLNNQELKRETCQLKYLSQQYPELYKESFNQTKYQNKEDYIMLNLGAFKVYRAGHTKWVKIYD